MSDNGLETLLKILKFPENLNHPHVEEFPHFVGDLRGKLEASLDRNKQNPTFTMNYDQFTWKQLEVGHLSGNQLLRALVAVFRNDEVFSPGSCIILTLNGEPDAAVYKLRHGVLGITTTSPQDPEKRRYFNKIFDEKKCNFMKSKPEHSQYFTDEKLLVLREQVPKQMVNFLTQPISQTIPEYRHAFMGMVQELLKFEMKQVPVNALTEDIPLVSCIWLAVENCISYKLQAIFGDHYLPKDEWFQDWRKDKTTIQLFELNQRRTEAKASERLNAAKKIIFSCIPVGPDGKYDSKAFSQIVDEIKTVFQVEEQY